MFVPNYPYIGERVVRLGLYSPATSKRLALAGTEASRREYAGREVRAAAAVGEHLPDLQGWLAPGRSRRRTTRRPSGSGRKKAATFSFRNPKKDATFYLEYDARIDMFTPPQQVTRPHRRSGRSARSRPTSKDKTLRDLPDHRRAVRHGRHGGDCRRRRSDLHARRRAIRASWASGSSTRSSSRSSRPSSSRIQNGPARAASRRSSVVFLDRARRDGRIAAPHEFRSELLTSAVAFALLCDWRHRRRPRSSFLTSGRTLSVKGHRVDGDVDHPDAAQRRGGHLRQVADREDRRATKCRIRSRRRRFRPSRRAGSRFGPDAVPSRPVRRDHRGDVRGARRRSAAGQRADPGRVELPAEGPVAQGGDGADAADAVDGPRSTRSATRSIRRPTSRRASST